MRVLFLLLFFASGTPIFVKAALKMDQVPALIEEMLSLHIDYKEFSPLLAQRSLKNYIQQFDPMEVYLLKEEAHSFFHLPESELLRLVKEFKREKFSQYVELNKTIVASIHRARKLRALIKTDLLAQKTLEIAPLKSLSFAKNKEALYVKLRAQLEGELAAYAKEKGKDTLDSEERLRLLDFYEKKRRAHEYTYIKGESSLACHIAKAVAAAFDPHTTYFSDDEALQAKALLQNEVTGLGLFLKEGLEGVQITKVASQSSLARVHHIAPGDLLIQVGETEVKKSFFYEVLQALEGKEGTKCSLVFQKPTGELISLSATREKIVLEEDRLQVDYELFAKGVIGKIQLPSFYNNQKEMRVSQDFLEALKELETKGPLLGLILDFRENRGGFLQEAVQIARLFSHKKTPIIAKYAHNEVSYTSPFHPRLSYEAPLVILTSKKTASAAEILALTLQEEGRAVIVGDKTTYGKGSMQHQTLTKKGSLHPYKVTVGLSCSGLGKTTQKEGVVADIEVPTQYAPYTLGERFLQYSLSKKSPALEEIRTVVPMPKRMTLLQKALPRLKTNSENRLLADANFQAFLAHLEGKGEASYGITDLQMKEAVNIAKDWIFLQKKLR